MQVKIFFKYFGVVVTIFVGGILVAGQISHYSVPIIDASGDLASLSDEGMFVIVNGTDHMSIVYEDETADHILSLIHLIGEKLEDE